MERRNVITSSMITTLLSINFWVFRVSENSNHSPILLSQLRCRTNDSWVTRNNPSSRVTDEEKWLWTCQQLSWRCTESKLLPVRMIQRVKNQNINDIEWQSTVSVNRYSYYDYYNLRSGVCTHILRYVFLSNKRLDSGVSSTTGLKELVFLQVLSLVYRPNYLGLWRRPVFLLGTRPFVPSQWSSIKYFPSGVVIYFPLSLYHTRSSLPSPSIYPNPVRYPNLLSLPTPITLGFGLILIIIEVKDQ